MTISRTLRPYAPMALTAMGLGFAALAIAWYAPLLPMVVRVLVPVVGFAFGLALFHGQRIVLNDGGIAVHLPSGGPVVVPSAAVASVRFLASRLEITASDGVEIAVSTPWYTRRQRDAVVAHIRSHAA